jgi:hypothetical protein
LIYYTIVYSMLFSSSSYPGRPAMSKKQFCFLAVAATEETRVNLCGSHGLSSRYRV